MAALWARQGIFDKLGFLKYWDFGSVYHHKNKERSLFEEKTSCSQQIKKSYFREFINIMAIQFTKLAKC